MDVGDNKHVSLFVALFSTDDGILADRCSARHQDAINTLISLFKHVGLSTNTTKMKCMVFMTGKIQM